MSKWDEFKKGLGELADKTVNKTRELTDTASLKIKIANIETDRDLEYKTLGQLAYVKLRRLEDNDERLTEQISESLEKLDQLNLELEELKRADKERKDSKEAVKQTRKREKANAEKAKKQESESLNLAVMEEFNEARVKADEEYEKARKAAEDAKNAE